MAYMNMGQDDLDTTVVFAHSPDARETTLVPMSGLTVTSLKPKFQWSQFTTALFSFIFCNCTFGLIGLIYGVLSYVDHKTGDFLHIERKKSCGWWWTILALAVGTVCWCVLIYTAVLFGPSIREFQSQFHA